MTNIAFTVEGLEVSLRNDSNISIWCLWCVFSCSRILFRLFTTIMFVFNIIRRYKFEYYTKGYLESIFPKTSSSTSHHINLADFELSESHTDVWLSVLWVVFSFVFQFWRINPLLRLNFTPCSTSIWSWRFGKYKLVFYHFSRLILCVWSIYIYF
jgi:hypothetical protein